jgi:hypothetical protein
MNPYKYYTKEQYEEFGNILETTEQIEARLKKHKTDDYINKKLSQSYKNEWKDRIYETNQYKGFWYYPKNEPEFID